MFFTSIVSAVDLINYETKSLIDNKSQIMLEFNGKVQEPKVFAINGNSQYMFDFYDVNNKLPNNTKQVDLNTKYLSSMMFLQSFNRMRLIIDAVASVTYVVERENNRIIITFNNLEQELVKSQSAKDKKYIYNLDFKKSSKNGSGMLIVDFSDGNVPVNIIERDKKVIIEIKGVSFAKDLAKSYDIKDFNTIVNKIDLVEQQGKILLELSVAEDFNKISYQIDNQLIVEIDSVTNTADSKKSSENFSGEKISLNFQDINIRTVIQLIAEFTDINIVTSDNVTGNITVRLQDVPWDHALDFILKSKSLAMTESNGVYWIAQESEILDRQKTKLEGIKNLESISELYAEYIQINYAKAEDMVKILKDGNNTVLTERGQVVSDERTNLLLVRDSKSSIEEVKKILKKFDIPMKQVLIEAQIVISNDKLTRGLGIKLGGGATSSIGRNRVAVAPRMESSSAYAINPATLGTVLPDAAAQNVFQNFTLSDSTSNIGISLARLPGGTLLDLELQAAEKESKSKVLSKPTLLTLDQKKATIEQGVDIPFQVSAGGNGVSTTEFKKATTKLEVTPHIMPGDVVSLDLVVQKDTPEKISTDGTSAIKTMSMQTNIVVPDGDTIVLGGVYDISESDTEDRVPGLYKLPIIGRLFRSDLVSSQQDELLIFVTPKIVKGK